MSITLLVSKFFPKFKLVIDLYPVPENISLIFVTLLVSKLFPKSKVVIAVYPVSENISRIFVTLLVFNKFKFVIVSVAVHLSDFPIFANKKLESVLAYIVLLLPIYTFNAPLELLVTYQANIEPLPDADTSHLVEFAPDVLFTNVTFSMSCLDMLFPRKLDPIKFSSLVVFNILTDAVNAISLS